MRRHAASPGGEHVRLIRMVAARAMVAFAAAASAFSAHGFVIPEDTGHGRWSVSGAGVTDRERPECERARCILRRPEDGAVLLGRLNQLMETGVRNPPARTPAAGRNPDALGRTAAARAALAQAHGAALREAIAALGGASTNSAAMLFAGAGFAPPGGAAPEEGAPRSVPQANRAAGEDGFAFGALDGWNALLAPSAAALQPRFGQMVYNVVEQRGRLAWSGAIAASGGDGPAARLPAGELNLGGGLPALAATPEPETRTIVVVTKGRAHVMIVRNPAAKK